MKYCIPKPYRLLYINHFGVEGVISYANSEAQVVDILTIIYARKKLKMDNVQLQELKT